VNITPTKFERVKIVLYNVLGQEAAQILDAEMSAGIHETLLVISQWLLGNGTYFMRLQTPTFTQLQTVQVMR